MIRSGKSLAGTLVGDKGMDAARLRHPPAGFIGNRRPIYLGPYSHITSKEHK